MLRVAISGATRDWLTRCEWGAHDGCSELARATRERLFAEPERRHGRGHRTVAALPDAQARELARVLAEESTRIVDERPSATTRALATDADRLRVLIEALAAKGQTGLSRGGARHHLHEQPR